MLRTLHYKKVVADCLFTRGDHIKKLSPQRTSFSPEKNQKIIKDKKLSGQKLLYPANAKFQFVALQLELALVSHNVKYTHQGTLYTWEGNVTIFAVVNQL